MAIADTIQSMYDNVSDVYDTITNVDVNTGKNLFNDTIRQGVTTYDGGVYNYNATRLTSTNWITLRAGTYTINAKTNTSKTLQISNITFDTNDNFYNLSGVSGIWKTLPFTFTTPIDIKWKCNFDYSDNSNITINEVNSIQLEKGSSATEYQPYTDNPTYKNIENIPKVIRNSYLEIMNNGIDKIWNNWEKVTGSGTDISLSPTLEAPMRNVLNGNTYQFTTTGKNLFNIEGSYETGTGITYTKNDDGSYILNGTASGNNFLRGVCHLNEQHTLSYKSDTSNSNVILRTRTGTPSAQTGIQDQLFVSSTSGSLTSSKQFDFVEISIVNGTTLNNFKIYIQLEKGSSVTSFEPYTGGQASPNPDFPQDIHVVSGDNKINVIGKNLYNINLLQSGTRTGITLTKNNDGSITINGTATSSTVFESNNFTIGENYILSGCYGGSSSTYKMDFFTNNAIYPCFNGEEVSLPSNANGRVRIVIYSGTTVNNVKIYPMLSTMGGDFQPYQSNTCNINLPVENLLQLPNVSTTSNGVTSTIINGKLKIVGTTTTNWFSICNLNIPLESGTYTFSYTNKKVNRYNLNIKYADNTTQIIYGNAYSNTPITLNQNATLIALFSDNNTTGATFDYEDYLMIEKGSKANSYTPYGTTPIKLCDINTYKDYFLRTSGKNLIPTSDIISTIGTVSNGVTFTRNSDGSITANGTATSAISIYINADYTELSAGTYTFSDSVPSGESGTTYFLYADVRHVDGTSWDAYNFSTANTTTGMTQDIPGDCIFKTRIVVRNGQTLNNVVFKPMLKKGTTALPYEPYGSGDWYLHKEIGSVTLKGTSPESWTTSGATTETSFVGALNLQTTGLITKFNTGDYWFCDKFTYGSLGVDYRFRLYNGDASAGYVFLGLTIPTSLASDINAFKTWLGNNNVTLYYVLKDTIITEVTGTLAEQLEAFYNAKSKNSQTNITQENNDLPFIIDSTMLKEIS